VNPLSTLTEAVADLLARMLRLVEPRHGAEAHAIAKAVVGIVEDEETAYEQTIREHLAEMTEMDASK
jgi:hypothetical protein